MSETPKFEDIYYLPKTSRFANKKILAVVGAAAALAAVALVAKTKLAGDADSSQDVTSEPPFDS